MAAPYAIPAPALVAVGDKIQASYSNANVKGLSDLLVQAPPRFMLHQGSSQSFANNTTNNLTWDSEDSDAYGFHAAGANNNRITIPAGYDGVYEFRAQVTWGSSTGSRLLQLVLNGTTIYGRTILPSGDSIQVASAQIAMAAGDEMFVQTSQSSGGSISPTLGINNTWFCGRFISVS